MKNNPFTLTFGKRPNKYINRYENTDTIISTFVSDTPVSNIFLIGGVRGSGKTVLMTTVEKILEEYKDWIIVDLNSTQDLIHDLAEKISIETNSAESVIKSGFNVSFAGMGIGINGNRNQSDIVLIEQYLSSLVKKKKKLLITIDEVMHNESMKRFASEFQIFLRKDYPVFLLMTGLYENIYSIQNDPSLTFLLRSPKIILGSLSMNQILKMYQSVFNTDNATIVKLAELTKGYAFAFQALGFLYYEYGEELPFEEIISKYDDLLDDFVYKKIWESLSDNDKKILLALGDSKTKVKDICEKTGIQSGTFSRYKNKLITKGLIDSSQHGYVSLTLPRFSHIIQSYF